MWTDTHVSLPSPAARVRVVVKPPRGASVCRTRADTFSRRDSLLERLLTKNDFKGTTYFSVGFLQLELIEFQKFLPVLAFDKIEDFFVSEIDAVVEIATPEHVVVGKNVLSLRCRENGDHSARLAGRAGEGRKSHGCRCTALKMLLKRPHFSLIP